MPSVRRCKRFGLVEEIELQAFVDKPAFEAYPILHPTRVGIRRIVMPLAREEHDDCASMHNLLRAMPEFKPSVPLDNKILVKNIENINIGRFF